MSRTLLVILGFAVAGAVGALAGRYLAPPPPASVAGDPDLARLESRIDDFEANLERFRDEVRRRLDTPTAAAPLRSAPAAAEPATGAAPEAAATRVSPEVLEEQVREVVEKEAAAREEAMGRRFAQMAEQREAGMLDRLANDLGLSPYQRTEMEKILARRRQAIGEFFRSMFGRPTGGEPVDMSTIREKVRDVQEETDEAVKQLLSTDQYEAFREEDQRMRRGPFFGGGGDRGGEGR